MTINWDREDDDDWVDQQTLRRVRTVVRNRRARLDELERQLRARQPDDWTAWVRQAQADAVRAEFEFWTRLLRRLHQG